MTLPRFRFRELLCPSLRGKRLPVSIVKASNLEMTLTRMKMKTHKGVNALVVRREHPMLPGLDRQPQSSGTRGGDFLSLKMKVM